MAYGTIVHMLLPPPDVVTAEGLLVPSEVALAYTDLMSVLFDGYTRRWSEVARRRFVATLHSAAGDHGYVSAELVLEAHVTAAMLSLSGPAETHLIARLCGAAGVTPSPRMGLYRMSEFFNYSSYKRSKRPAAGRTTATEPDFVVAIVDGDTITPVLFAEVKRSANVSFGYGYCNLDDKHLVYASQVSCYPHGCWLKPADDAADTAFKDARWVWIGPGVYSSHEDGPWGGSIAVPDDAGDARSLTADLEVGRGRWAPVTLSELAAWVRATPIDHDPVLIQVGEHTHRELQADSARAGYAAFADVVDEWAAWGPVAHADER